MADDLSGRSRPLRAAALMAVFMISLDVSIVNIALPTLARDLNASLASLQWMLDGYIAAFASLLLVTARLNRSLGSATSMRIGVIGFTVASAACALAWSPTALVVARILQGVAASLILPAGLTLVTRLAAPDRRGRALGAFSAVVGAATAFGPSAGAVVLSVASWPGIFLVNIPVGLAVLWMLRGETQPRVAHERGWWLDGALSAAGLFALCQGLIDAGRHGWGSTRALVAGAVGVAALALFGFLQSRRGASAVLDVSLLRRPAVLGANTATLLTFTAMMGATFLAPLVLIGLYGYSLGRTALVLSATSIAILVVALASGRLVDRVRISTVGVLGFVVIAGSLWGFSFLGPAPAFGWVLLAAAVLGLGIGIALPPLTTHAMSGTSTEQLEDASALFSTFRQIGLALGVAVFGSLAATLVGHQLTTGGFGSDTALVDLSVAQLGEGATGQPAAAVAEAIWRGLADTFRIGGAIALLAAVPLLLSDRRWRSRTASTPNPAGSRDRVFQRAASHSVEPPPRAVRRDDG